LFYTDLVNFFHTRPYILFVGFVSGFSIMVLELSAVRLLGPYFGTSIAIWTNIIAIILVCLSLGSYLGGRIAEKKDDTILPKILIIGGFFIAIIPIISSIIFSLIFSGIFGLNLLYTVILGSFLSAIILFGIPVTFLGMLGPYLISVLHKNFPEAKNNTGIFLCLSTVGALLGTLLPTLLLISLIGTKITILICGVLVCLIGIPLMPKKRLSALLAILFVILFTPIQPKIFSSSIAEKESIYQFIWISESGETRYMKFDSGFGIESAYNPNSFLTGEYYYDYANILPIFTLKNNQEPIKILVLGLAGGTIPRALHHYYGEKVSIDAVDIDKDTVALAKEYMGLDEVPVNIFYEDGRSFLRKSSTLYDVIYVDVFAQELQIPWHMTTKEFWRSVSDHLKDKGILGMNIVAFGSPSSLIDSFSQTQLTVFPFVYHIDLAPKANNNHLLLVSRYQINPKTFSISEYSRELKPVYDYFSSHMQPIYQKENSLILTDNSAPVEFLFLKDLLKTSQI